MNGLTSPCLYCHKPIHWAADCCMILGSVEQENTLEEEMLKPVAAVELSLICKDHKSAAELKIVEIVQENKFSSTAAEALGLIVHKDIVHPLH